MLWLTMILITENFVGRAIMELYLGM